LKYLFYILAISSIIFLGCAKANEPLAIEDIKIMSVENVFETVGIPQEMALSEDYLFIAEDQAGFSIFDKKSTDLIVRKDSHSAYDEFSNIRQIGFDSEENILFIFDRYGPPTIYSFDITDPKEPIFKERITAGDIQSTYYMSISNNEDGSIFLGITTTNSAFRYGTIHKPYVNMDLTTFHMPNAVKKFDIVDNYAYIAGSQRGLYIFDMESRTLLSELNLTGDALDISVKGDYAYIVAKQEGLIVVDISDKSNPVWDGKTYPTSGWAQSIDLDGDYLVVGSGGGGVYLYDIKNTPEAPKLLDRLSSNEVDYTLLVAIEGETIYAAGRYKGVSKIKIDR